MADHLELTPHLHDVGYENRIRSTYLGQAHFAGSGPAKRTCRECAFYYLEGRNGKHLHRFYAATNKEKANQLKRHKCNFRIPHKANRRIPHEALACTFFEPAEEIPPVCRVDIPKVSNP